MDDSFVQMIILLKGNNPKEIRYSVICLVWLPIEHHNLLSFQTNITSLLTFVGRWIESPNNWRGDWIGFCGKSSTEVGEPVWVIVGLNFVTLHFTGKEPSLNLIVGSNFGRIWLPKEL